MKQNQNGFGIVGSLFMITVIVIVGLAGYAVYRANFSDKTVIHNAPAVTSNLQPKPQSQPVDNLHVAALPDISTATWPTFKESGGLISYRYPADWQFKNHGSIYYGQSWATSDNKSTVQTLKSPNSDPKADWGNNYENLTGAQITVNVSDDYSRYDHSSDDDPSPSDYCKNQTAPILEQLDNGMCIKTYHDPKQYTAGADYCSLFLHADIILGGKNTVERDKEYMQVLVAIAKSWDFKNVCSTDSQGVEHIYFVP